MVTAPFDYALLQYVRAVDGDTVEMIVDLGFGVRHHGKFRVITVDTPERGDGRWDDARTFTHCWLSIARNPRTLRVATYKADSFGRWLADIYDPVTGESLAEALLASGHAVPYVK